MSRLRRLKKLRRKNRIKATACGLALALAIGSSQGLGTYALFTDVEDVSSNLAISTGDVDVEVSDGIDFIDVQPQDNIEVPFVITNKGTLNQNVSLKLDISTGISKYLTYGIIFSNDNITRNGEILYNGSDLLVLSPGETINGSIQIAVGNMSSEIQKELYGKVQDIELSIKSTQINKDNTLVNNGFYDVEIQRSTIMIGEENVIYGDAVKVTPANGYNEDSTVSLKVSNTTNYSGLESVIDNIENVDRKNIEITSKKGAFKNTNSFDIGGQWYTFYDKVDTRLIGNGFGQGNDISVKLKYNDGSYKIYNFDFKVKDIVNGNRLLAVKVTLEQDAMYLIDEDIDKPSESEIVSISNEKVEVSSESEIVNTSNEKVEVPSQSQIVELPKVEEVEISTESNLIEQSKEEIQVVLPNQTDIIAEKRE